MPFTRASLQDIKHALRPPCKWLPGSVPPHTVSFSRGKVASESAVLIPLMNVGNRPHILLEVRSSNLRTHAGEVSFPGGRMDLEDPSLLHAALRETQEELELPAEHIEVLGMLDSPEYSLGNRSRVWPFVGFVHATGCHQQSSEVSSLSSLSSLSSFSLEKLVASPDEVAAILPLPLAAVLDPSRRRTHHFRLDVHRPYYTIRVGDLVAWPPDSSPADRKAYADLEVWGLSGWFLNCLAWKAGWLKHPPPGPEYED